MGDKTEVWQGTLALMVLKTLDTMGPLHGYGIARRIEQALRMRLASSSSTKRGSRGTSRDAIRSAPGSGSSVTRTSVGRSSASWRT